MTSPSGRKPPRQQSPVAAPARGAALAVTNLTKFAGLIVAVNESVLRSELRPSVLAVAAFMMAGAQVSETVLLSVIDRFLGRGR